MSCHGPSIRNCHFATRRTAAPLLHAAQAFHRGLCARSQRRKKSDDRGRPHHAQRAGCAVSIRCPPWPTLAARKRPKRTRRGEARRGGPPRLPGSKPGCQVCHDLTAQTEHSQAQPYRPSQLMWHRPELLLQSVGRKEFHLRNMSTQQTGYKHTMRRPETALCRSRHTTAADLSHARAIHCQSLRAVLAGAGRYEVPTRTRDLPRTFECTIESAVLCATSAQFASHTTNEKLAGDKKCTTPGDSPGREKVVSILVDHHDQQCAPYVYIHSCV